MTAKKSSKTSAAIQPNRGVPLDGFPTDDLKILLGRVARDIITGYEGVIVQYGVWLNGCVRIAIQSTKLDDKGMPPEPHTFDLQQVEVLGKRSPVEEMVMGKIVRHQDGRTLALEVGERPAEQPATTQPGGPDRKGASAPWSTR